MAATVGTIHSRAKILGSGLTIITGECTPDVDSVTVIVRTALKHITAVCMDYMEPISVIGCGLLFPWWEHGTGLDGDLVTMHVTTVLRKDQTYSGGKISFTIYGLE